MKKIPHVVLIVLSSMFFSPLIATVNAQQGQNLWIICKKTADTVDIIDAQLDVITIETLKGPASSVPNTIPTFANVTGTLLQDTAVTIDGLNNITGINSLTANTVFSNLVGNSTGNVVGNVIGAASLNVLKAGDTMTGTLNLQPLSGNALTAHGVAGSAALAITPNATSPGISIGSTSGNALAINTNAFTVIGSTGNTTIGGTLNTLGATTLSNLSATGVVHTNGTGLLSTSLIVNADVDPTAAIDYSKLNLTNSIVNADINSSADIVDTKLATISTAGKVANSATTATSSNTANTIVARDGLNVFSTNEMTILGTVTNATDVATKAYVDSAVAATFMVKAPALVGSLSEITISGLQTIDSVPLNANDRVLLIGQGNPTGNPVQNGLWLAATGTWNRPPDFATGPAGQSYVLITSGATLAGTGWVCTTPTAIIDTDPLAFTQFSTPAVKSGANVGTGSGQLFQGITGTTFNFRSLQGDSYLAIANSIDNNEVNFTTNATGINAPNTIVARDSSGNLAANIITASLIGNVSGSSSLNVLKAGDTMTGTLVHPAGSAATPSIQFTGSTNTGFSAATVNTLSLDTNGSERMTIDPVGNVSINGLVTGIAHVNGSGTLSSSLIVNADISTSAALPDSQLATISTAGKVANSATTATGNNIINTIVARNSSGNFSVNVITAGLIGNVTGTVFGNISGNVTGAASLNVLKTGDTMTGTLVHPAGSAAAPSIQFTGSTNTGFSAATANRLSFGTNASERMSIDATGNVSINGLTTGIAHLNGSGTLSSSLIVNADVSATAAIVDSKLATISTAGKVANSATTATGNNIINTIVARDGSGNFSAGTITANMIGSVSGASSLNVLKAGDTMTGVLTIPAGSAASPALQFTGTTNTGLFATTTNSLGLTTNGSLALLANVVGQVGIGTSTPYTQLVVPGNVPSAAVGSVAAGTTPYNIYVQGRYAYVTNNGSTGANGFQVFNVSNPTSPVLIGSATTGSGPRGLYVQGNYAYVTNTTSNTLQVIDISNQASPVVVSTTTTGGDALDVYVQGRYAYITSITAGQLQIYDVSNANAPVRVGSVTSSSTPAYVYVQGRYAYVANNSGDLQIFDVSNPTSPTSVGTVLMDGAPVDIYVQGSYAYVVTQGTSNLVIINISNPTAPTVVIVFTGVFSAPQSLYVQGRYAYITNTGNNTVNIVDVSTPASPVNVGTITTSGPADGIFVQGRYAYVTNATSNALQIFDVGGAYIQQLEAGGMEVGTLATRENMTVNNDLDVRGGATFARGFDSTGNSSITTLTSPGTLPTVQTGSIATGTEPRALYVQGRYAYVVNATSSTLQIVDISTPASPVNVGSVATGSAPFWVYVQGRYAYVVTLGGNTLQIFDVSNPAAPTLVGAVTLNQGPISVYVQGRYAYTCNISGTPSLQIIDVSNPAAPLVVGTQTAGINSPRSVYVQGRYACLCNESGNNFQIVDVSNPAAPTSVGSVSTGTNPHNVYVQGRYAYIVNNGASQFQIIDISNPASPTIVSTTSVGTNPSAIYVQGNYAYIVNQGSNTLQLFNISTPTAPISLGTVATGSGPGTLVVQGRYVYISNQTANTLQTFDLGGTYIQQLEAGGMEVGTLATRENLTVNNDLDVRGGVTFARGFDATGDSSILGQFPIIGSASVTGTTSTLTIPAGTTALPSLKFNGSTNTGFSATGTNTLQIDTNGTLAMTINGNGQVGIGTATPYTQLVVNTAAYIQQLEAGGVQTSTLQTLGTTTINNDLDVRGSSTFSRGFNSTNNSSISTLTSVGSLPSTQTGSASTSVSGPNSLYVQGRYAYVLSNPTPTTTTLDIFDMSNSSVPLLLSSTLVKNATAVYVQGRYAYLTGSPTTSGVISAYDISNPTSPTFVGTCIAAQGVTYLYVQGRYAYAVSDNLFIFDVSNPALITLVGTGTGITTSSNAVYVQGTYAYLANSLGVYILNVSNPSSPTIVSHISFSGGSLGIYVQGNYAYILDNTNTLLRIYNIANPASPVAVSTIGTGNHPNGIYVQGNYAYVVNASDNNLQVINVTNPASPTTVGTISTNTFPTTIFVQGRYAYLTNNISGTLQIFALGGTYIQQLEAGGMEVGTLATRENMTINNDLAITGGATFARGWQANGGCAVTSNAAGIPAMIVQGDGSTAGTALRLKGMVSAAGGTTLVVDANGNVYKTTSSKRFKENIRTIDHESSIMYDLNPVLYDYKAEHGDIKNEFGFIAEEAAEVMPSMVNYDLDGRPLSINYNTLHAPVIKELQKQSGRLNNYTRTLEQQQSAIDALYNQHYYSASCISQLAAATISKHSVQTVSLINNSTAIINTASTLVQFEHEDSVDNVTLMFPHNPADGQLITFILKHPTTTIELVCHDTQTALLKRTVSQKSHACEPRIITYSYNAQTSWWSQL